MVELKNCPDCGAASGFPHVRGCDVERCPKCGGQLISCDCQAFGAPPVIWTGEWPGVAECREFGWYCKLIRGQGWVNCEKDEPGASEDLNRLDREAVWDEQFGRHVLRKP
jgi:hypothetical protein